MAMVTSVWPVPWNKPEVVLYTPLVKHQNAITLKKSAAMPTTSASLEKILTIAVEIISLDKIIPPMNKNTTDIHMEKRYPFSARSDCFAPMFCPTMVAVAEPMALEGSVISPFTLLPMP